MILSVIIPAFNEGNNLTPVIEELEKEILKIKSIDNYEIIVIDDHSSDNTFEAIDSLNSKHVQVVRLSKNSGSHVAIRAGLNLAIGDKVLCIAADGQEDPSFIAEMLKKSVNSQIIWGVRKARKEPLLSKFFAIFFYGLLKRLSQSTATNIDIANADFYMLDRSVVTSINQIQETNTSLFGLLLWIGYQHDFVLYHRRERFSGTSKWNFTSRMKLAFDWIIAFSGVPLKLITYFGFILSFIGFAYIIVLIVLSFSGYTKPGWAESVILMLIIGGIQMIMLGIVGEYLWRTLDQTRNRPLFFIEKKSNKL